ncbi:MAG TPA: hypothetical protein VF941_07620 [Clostridia bacterium]
MKSLYRRRIHQHLIKNGSKGVRGSNKQIRCIFMLMKNNRFNFKIIVISFFVSITVFTLGRYILGYMGVIYSKDSEGEKNYEFVEDMNADGKKEKVKFVNHYCCYSLKNACDAEYTSNFIKIYLDDKEIYSDNIVTLEALLNPQMIDSVEKGTIKKQICVHDHGGGPAIPKDYLFYVNEGKVVVSRKEPSD